MESGSTRLRLVETETGWELREPGREKPLRRVTTRDRGLRSARCTLESDRGGTVEVVAVSGEVETMEFVALTRRQRRWMLMRPRFSLTLAALAFLLLATGAVLAIIDGPPFSVYDILSQFVVPSLIGVWVLVMIIQSVRRYRRPL